MKVQALKEIHALSTEIAAKKAEIETINADIERAQSMVIQADQLDQELETLTRKRAEHRAWAFVSRQPADMTDLDSQLEAFERTSRSIREDGVTAALAITMLEAKRTEVEEAIAALQGKHKLVIVDWLHARREKAIDRYMELIQSLGPIIAEAAGADQVCRKIEAVPWSPREVGTWLLKEIKEHPFPYPLTRGKQMPMAIVTPFDWLRDFELVERESRKITEELATAEFNT